eukprot:scaffold14036_cov72-Isochrysis_galbana.AAC.2
MAPHESPMKSVGPVQALCPTRWGESAASAAASQADSWETFGSSARASRPGGWTKRKRAYPQRWRSSEETRANCLGEEPA